MADDEHLARAHRLMATTPLIDGHNDLPWQYRSRVNNHVDRLDIAQDLTTLESPTHTDLPRLRAGRLGAQFWSVYIPISTTGGRPGDAKVVIEQIDLVRRLVSRYPDDLEIAYTADDVERIFKQGRIASMMGMEGGHSIENSLAVLRATYALGARYMTLTHSKGTFWADSATDDPRHDGLTAFGEEVVREMNRLGMLVDLSHVAPATMHDAMDVSMAPVIFSHSSARALCDHPRNVPDDVLARLPDQGGVVMITFVPRYLSQPLNDHTQRRREAQQRFQDELPDDASAVDAAMARWDQDHPSPRATLGDVADHIEHVARVAGIDHVGIGSDFDGIGSLPVGLEDVSKFPSLFAELLRRGFSDDDVRKVLGENLLAVMREVEAVAAGLQRERPPSDATIEELDGIDPAALWRDQ
ncbi:MAG: dipeptidase [Planctomycetes bacterium]|nr:dipeptidase [Planctomycetota bacterium]